MSKWNEIKKLIREAQKNGWVITPTKKCHYKWQKNGYMFYSSSTPHGDGAIRAIRDTIAKAEQGRTIRH